MKSMILPTLLLCFATPASGVPTQPFTADDLSRVDVRGTASSIAMVAATLDQLTPEDRKQAVESLEFLSVNDPYTRAALQLPFALHATVSSIPPERIDRFIRHDWLALTEGLATHVALFEALGVDLPVPRPNDALYEPGSKRMIDVEALLADSDPLATTSSLIAAITPIASKINAPTQGLIEEHSDRVEDATGIGRPCPRGPNALLPGHPWTLGMQLGGWDDALRRMEPFVRDPEAKVRVAAMIDVLHRYGQVSFVSSYPPLTGCDSCQKEMAR